MHFDKMTMTSKQLCVLLVMRFALCVKQLCVFRLHFLRRPPCYSPLEILQVCPRRLGIRCPMLKHQRLHSQRLQH